MSATTTERHDVEAYLAAVRRELADLRPNERDELLADVEASLLDAAEESDAPIAARLGPPADFAAELRAAAGLSTPSAPRPHRKQSLLEAWRSPRAEALKRTLVELAPIWWVVRGYVVVALLAWLIDAEWVAPVPFIPRLGTPGFGLFILALAVGGSVAVGLWQRRLGRAGTLDLALNVILAVAALPIGADLLKRMSNRSYAETYYVEASPQPGLSYNGAPVENVYAYSRDGRLLLDVLLYDQTGAPLDLRAHDSDPRRRVLRTKGGASLFNSFPVRYYEPGTSRVGRPGAAPSIDWSPIVTPALLRKPATKP